METLEMSRVVGCYNVIVEALDKLGKAHKGRWSYMLRKHYENGIRAAELLRDSATATNSRVKQGPKRAHAKRTS